MIPKVAVNFQQAVRRHIPENDILWVNRHKKLNNVGTFKAFLLCNYSLDVKFVNNCQKNT
jgi:hypothetical protein